jgi:hypothetical protein
MQEKEEKRGNVCKKGKRNLAKYIQYTKYAIVCTEM